jgi:hypothetical protein
MAEMSTALRRVARGSVAVISAAMRTASRMILACYCPAVIVAGL